MGRNDIRDRVAYDKAQRRKRKQEQQNQSAVIREVVRIINDMPGRTLHASSEIAALVELREEGALGQFDKGTTRLDRRRPDVNKLGRVCQALKEAIAAGLIHRNDCDGNVLLALPSSAAVAPSTNDTPLATLEVVCESAEDRYEDPCAFRSHIAVRLREWHAA